MKYNIENWKVFDFDYYYEEGYCYNNTKPCGASNEQQVKSSEEKTIEGEDVEQEDW